MAACGGGDAAQSSDSKCRPATSGLQRHLHRAGQCSGQDLEQVEISSRAEWGLTAGLRTALGDAELSSCSAGDADAGALPLSRGRSAQEICRNSRACVHNDRLAVQVRHVR